MTYRKTHLWISLIVGMVVWGAYFVHFVRVMREGDPDGLALWFIGALAVVAIAETAVAGAVAWLFRKRARTLDDGPTLNAALKAGHVALMLLIGMLLVLAGLLCIPALSGWMLIGMSVHAPIIAAHLLLGMVVITELVRAGLTLALMPRAG